MKTIVGRSVTTWDSGESMGFVDGPHLEITECPRILIVEDDPGMAEVIGTLLQSHWLNCVIRHSGAQGIQAFTGGPVDLIITDLRMSAGDGIALIEAIRRRSQVPVIIVTGFAKEYADRVRFLDNVAMISKPFESRLLLDLVEKCLDMEVPEPIEGGNDPEIDSNAS